MCPVPDAVAQHVDGATLVNLTLQPGQELAPRWTVLGQPQRFRNLRLGGSQEGGELNQVQAVLAVVVMEASAAPAHAAVARRRYRRGPRHERLAGMPGQRRTDEAFEPPFGGVGGHASTSSAVESSSSSAARGSTLGSAAAASRTSSLPVTTSAIKRVRYSRMKSLSR